LVDNSLNKNHLSLLKRNVVFESFDYRHLKELQYLYGVSKYQKNQLIEAANCIPKEIHFVIYGGIKRALQKSKKKDYIFDITEPNNLDCFFFEWSSKMPSSADLISLENETVLISIALMDWDKFLNKHPKLRQVFLDYLFLKYQCIEKRISMKLLTYKSKDRYQLLINEFPKLNLTLTKKEMAAYIGVSPETISRLLIHR